MKKPTSAHTPFLFFFLSITLMLPLYAQESASNTQLKFCISSYKSGFYKKTVDCINEIFPGISQKRDSVLAFKYLGLSYGLLNNISLSKECFLKVFALQPSLDLDTMEIPPTIALILNQIKLEMKIAQMEKTMASSSPQPAVSKQTPVVASGRKSLVLPILLQSTAILAAGGSGYFFSNASRSYRSYKDNGSNRGGRSYSNFKTSMVAGASCAIVSLSLTTFSIFLLLNDTSEKQMGFEVINGYPALAYRF